MKFDRELVEFFIEGLNREYGNSYGNPVFPEDQDRNSKAVEAIFTDKEGRSLAIEHTLIQPFMKEREDGFGALDKIFAPLETDASLRIPDYYIHISVPALSVPKGEKWGDVAQKVRDWFIQEGINLPDGASKHVVPGLSFPLTLRVWKDHYPGDAGKVTISRIDIPDTFPAVVQKALSDKVPKLVAAAADNRVLLLEKNVPIPGIVTIEDAIQQISPNCPDFDKVDEIWVANTVAWKSEGVIFFERAFADSQGMRARFKHRK